MRLWHRLRPERGLGLAVAGCGGSGLVKSAALPLASWTIFHRPEMPALLGLTALYAGLMVGAYHAEMRSAIRLRDIVGDAVHRTRLALAERVRLAELRAVERCGAALAETHRDLEDLRAVGGVMQGRLRAAFELAGYLIYALAVVGPVTLLLVAGLLWLAVGMRRHAEAQRAALRGAGGREQALGGALDDLWSGMPRFVLDRRAMADVRAHAGRRRTALTGLLRGHDRALRESSVFNSSRPLVVGALLTLVAVGPLQMSGHVAFAFVTLVFMTRGPTHVLLDAADLVRAEQALARLEALEATLDAARIGPPAAEGPAFERLDFEDVGFAFEDGGFTLGPMSLSLRRGELVFVVGHNGSGKTTLMKVISGLYPARGGRIRADGRPLDRARLRALFTVAFIDAHLFERPYGLDASEAALHEALALVGLDEVVEVVDGRFSTLDLSTGQRRRLALAVALLERRPVLVLDEWDAHQDPETRRFYFETLLPRLAAEGRAVVAVCHDDRFFAVADRVVTLREGRLVDPPVSDPR